MDVTRATFKDIEIYKRKYDTTGIYEGEKTVYHTGYNNNSAFIVQIKPYVGEPDTLLVTGFSAGGFATALLADDVIDRFPSAGNVTVCVDSSLLLYNGWHDTAVDLLGDNFQQDLKEMVIALQENIPNVGIYLEPRRGC